jgi:hypothetical protein
MDKVYIIRNKSCCNRGLTVKNYAHFTGTILTIGHSARTAEDFIRLLKENNLGWFVDIRTIPRSRHNPQFNGNILPNTLSKA